MTASISIQPIGFSLLMCRIGIHPFGEGCYDLLVYKHGDLLGLRRLPDVAHQLSLQRPWKSLLVNILGGVTLVLTLAVIARLIMEFPNMLAIADRVTR